MLKHLGAAAGGLLAAWVAGGAWAGTAASIEGDWQPNTVVVVRIAPCAGSHDKLCGTLLAWPKEEDGGAPLDRANHDARLAQRPLIGLRVISGLREVSPGVWSGKGYNPEDGNTNDVTLSAVEGGVKSDTCRFKRCFTQVWKPFR